MDWDEVFENGVECADCPYKAECDALDDEDIYCGQLLRQNYDADVVTKYQDDVDEIRDKLEQIHESVEAVIDRHHQEWGSTIPSEIRSVISDVENLWDKIGG